MAERRGVIAPTNEDFAIIKAGIVETLPGKLAQPAGYARGVFYLTKTIHRQLLIQHGSGRTDLSRSFQGWLTQVTEEVLSKEDESYDLLEQGKVIVFRSNTVTRQGGDSQSLARLVATQVARQGAPYIKAYVAPGIILRGNESKFQVFTTVNGYLQAKT